MKKKRPRCGPMMIVGGVWVIDDEYYVSETLRSIKREISPVASFWRDPIERLLGKDTGPFSWFIFMNFDSTVINGSKKNNVKVEIRWKGWLMSTLYICDETIKINESWKYRSSSRNVNGSCVLSLWLRMIQTMTNKGFILDPCQVWHCLICYEN